MSHVVGVYMIIVMQKDLQVGVEFYKKLGLQVVFYIPGKWCELQSGSLKIGLCPTEEQMQGNRNSGIVFQVNDVKGSYEFLKNEEIEFLNEPTIATHGIMVTCVDPSGNIFDLYQPTHDKLKQVLDKELCGADNCEDGCCKSMQQKGCC